MHSSTAFTVITQALLLGAFAQNSTSSSSNSTRTCSDIDDAVQYNASTTRQVPALKLSGPRPTALHDRFAVEVDDSKFWELSLRVRKQPEDARANTGRLGPGPYQQAMFLDTGDSNMTDIGSCHQTIQAETGAGSFQWAKEVLERSVKDNGDCMTLLGDGCVQALKQKARESAGQNPLRTGKCTGMNTTMPPECSGVGPQVQNRQMNLTYLSGVPEVYLNSQFDQSLECNGVNVSSTHSVTVAERMAYDAAVRFPVIDVITFWPNRSEPQAWSPQWASDVHVEVVCMRPDSNIAEDSETPSSASDVLAKENATFPTGSGASALGAGSGFLALMSAVVVGTILVV